MNNMYQLRNQTQYTDRAIMVATVAEGIKTNYERKLLKKAKNLVDVADAIEKSIVDMTNDNDISQAKNKIQHIDSEIQFLCNIICYKPSERKKLIKANRKEKSKAFFKSIFTQIHTALYSRRKNISTLFFAFLIIYFVAESVADGFMSWNNDYGYKTNQYRYIIESIRFSRRNIRDFSEISLILIGSWFLYNIVTSCVLAIQKAKNQK